MISSFPVSFVFSASHERLILLNLSIIVRPKEEMMYFSSFLPSFHPEVYVADEGCVGLSLAVRIVMVLNGLLLMQDRQYGLKVALCSRLFLLCHNFILGKTQKR
jgi:hypothetical protein